MSENDIGEQNKVPVENKVIPFPAKKQAKKAITPDEKKEIMRRLANTKNIDEEVALATLVGMSKSEMVKFFKTNYKNIYKALNKSRVKEMLAKARNGDDTELIAALTKKTSYLFLLGIDRESIAEAVLEDRVRSAKMFGELRRSYAEEASKRRKDEATKTRKSGLGESVPMSDAAKRLLEERGLN